MSGEETTPRTAGEMLRAARQARGISLAEVSAITRVSEQQLAALENDEFDKLSGSLYARSFMRAFAVAVGGSPDEILERFDQQTGVASRADVQPDTWQEEVQVKRIGRGRALLWLRAVGLIVLALAAALILARVLLPSGDATGAIGGAEPPAPAAPTSAATSALADSAQAR